MMIVIMHNSCTFEHSKRRCLCNDSLPTKLTNHKTDMQATNCYSTKKPDNHINQSINQQSYDMIPNQIKSPKKPSPQEIPRPRPRAPAHPPQPDPDKRDQRRKANRPSHSPPEIPAPGAISLSGGTRKCGTGGYRLQAPKRAETSGRTLRKTPRSPNPAAETSGSPSLEMRLSRFPSKCMWAGGQEMRVDRFDRLHYLDG